MSTSKSGKARLAKREASRRNRGQASDMGQFEMRPKAPQEISGYFVASQSPAQGIEVMQGGTVYVTQETYSDIKRLAPDFAGSLIVYQKLG